MYAQKHDKNAVEQSGGGSDGGSQWYKREDIKESQSESNILMRERGADDNAARLASVTLILLSQHYA